MRRLLSLSTGCPIFLNQYTLEDVINGIDCSRLIDPYTRLKSKPTNHNRWKYCRIMAVKMMRYFMNYIINDMVENDNVYEIVNKEKLVMYMHPFISPNATFEDTKRVCMLYNVKRHKNLSRALYLKHSVSGIRYYFTPAKKYLDRAMELKSQGFNYFRKIYFKETIGYDI